MNNSVATATLSDAKQENEVRQRILDAAFAVLQEVGPTRLRIQEVSKRAKVSATLLYYYFDGRNALIAAAYAHDYERILANDMAILHGMFDGVDMPTDVLPSLMDAYQSSFTDVETRRRRLDALAAAQHDPTVAAAIAPMQRAFIEELRRMVEEMQANGWIGTVVDVNSFMMAMMALPLGLVFRDLDPTFEIDTSSYLMTVLPSPAA